MPSRHLVDMTVHHVMSDGFNMKQVDNKLDALIFDLRKRNYQKDKDDLSTLSSSLTFIERRDRGSEQRK